MQIQTIQNIQQAVAYIQALPVARQRQVFDFIEMVQVYESQTNTINLAFQNPTENPKNQENKKDAGKFSDIFGMVKAKKSATLEEMDNAIKQRGAGL